MSLLLRKTILTDKDKQKVIRFVKGRDLNYPYQIIFYSGNIDAIFNDIKESKRYSDIHCILDCTDIPQNECDRFMNNLINNN